MEVVKWIDTIVNIATDMCEATGSPPDPDLLAEVLLPSMDESCLRELETYQMEGTPDSDGKPTETAH